MLSIKNLTKTYSNGVKALNDVSLDIPKGMFGFPGCGGFFRNVTLNETRISKPRHKQVRGYPVTVEVPPVITAVRPG